VYGEIPQVDGEAVAELIDRLVQELLNVLHQVFVVPGKAAPVLQCRAHLLHGKACLAVRARNIRPLNVGKIVGIEFYPYTVKNLVYRVNKRHKNLHI
jgi:hypothetical protein